MLNLKVQIQHAQSVRDQLAQRLAEQDQLLRELRKLQMTECDHEFSKPLKGYEHEGGTCIHCGINEVFWECNRNKR